jgi:hypothetical protein
MDLPPTLTAFASCRRILRVVTQREQVVCEAFVSGKLRARLVSDVATLGLPPLESDGVELSRRDAAVPSYVLNTLASGLVASDAAPDPVWLALDRPAGSLPMLPWERDLAPALKAPVLRLPHLPVSPYAARASLDLAVCFGCPDDSTDMLAAATSVLQAVPYDAASRVRVYVFARPLVAAHLEQQRPLFRFAELNIHAAERLPASSPESSDVSNPWLVWMRSVLGATAVDCVQFVTHCVQIEEQGKLAFASLNGPSPTTDFRANAREVAAFLERAGAWSAAFVSPPSNTSDVGMRMLQDQIAWLRPASLYVVTLQSPDDVAALEAANRFVLGPDITTVPNRPQQLSMLCHPAALQSVSTTAIGAAFAMLPGVVGLARLLGSNPITQVAIQATATAALKSLLNDTTLTARLAGALKSRDITPAHIASTQRAFERVLAQLSDPLEQEAIRAAAIKTLKDTAERFSVLASAHDTTVLQQGLDGITKWLATWRAR